MTDLEQAEKMEQVHLAALFAAFLTISLCGIALIQTMVDFVTASCAGWTPAYAKSCKRHFSLGII